MAQAEEENQKRVTVVIVTNQLALTAADAMAEVRRSGDAGLLHCVPVDNGSRNGTPDLLCEQSGWADVVLGTANVEFDRGCNIGLDRVTTLYTLFLNLDASLGRPAIHSLLVFMDANPRVGVCGPAAVVGGPAQKPRYEVAGRRIGPVDVVTGLLCSSLAPNDSHRPIQYGVAPYTTGWICGLVMMVRTDLLKRLGGFDLQFFLYWEETDVCKRIEDGGYEAWTVPSELARHVGDASSGKDETRIAGCIAKHYCQSRWHFMIKHHGWLATALAEGFEACILGLFTVADVLRGRGLGRLRLCLKPPLFSTPLKVVAA